MTIRSHSFPKGATREALIGIVERLLGSEGAETASASMDNDYMHDLLDEWFDLHDREIRHNERRLPDVAKDEGKPRARLVWPVENDFMQAFGAFWKWWNETHVWMFHNGFIELNPATMMLLREIAEKRSPGMSFEGWTATIGFPVLVNGHVPEDEFHVTFEQPR